MLNSRQPNILLIQTDQAAPHWLPCYGHPVVKMPHLNTLAQEGVVFDNAYCNSPLCVPSRNSMMSGQLPSRIAAYDGGSDFPATIPCFTHYLRIAGYRTILSGKMHFVGPDQLHGFEERLTTEIYVSDYSWTRQWTRFGERTDDSYNMSSVMQAGVCVASMQLDYDEEVAYQATRKLYSLVRDPDQRPFCLVVSFTHPHDPYITTQAYWDRYQDEEIDLPRVPPIPYEQLDTHSQRLWHECAMGEVTIDDATIRRARHGYYGSLSYIDDKIGQLIHTLKATGQYENTVILFTSDHGEMLGERGAWYKMSMFEQSARVPLVVHAPQWFTPRRIPENVALVDLLPTLLAIGTHPRLCGADGPKDEPDSLINLAAPIDGQSLLPLLWGDSSQARDCVYVEYMADGVEKPLLMIRQGHYKYIYSEGDPELLYDLVADPLELTNVSNHPAYTQTLAGLRDLCKRQWHPEQLRQQIIADQQRRLLLSRALRIGKRTHWDYQPVEDATQQYIRPHMPAWDLMWRLRYPPVQPQA